MQRVIWAGFTCKNSMFWKLSEPHARMEKYKDPTIGFHVLPSFLSEAQREENIYKILLLKGWNKSTHPE